MLLLSVALVVGCASPADDDLTQISASADGPPDGAETTSFGETGTTTTAESTGQATTELAEATSESGSTDSSSTGQDHAETTATPEESSTGYDDPRQECLDTAVTECETCLCIGCLHAVDPCSGDAGCRALRRCAVDQQCVGESCLVPCASQFEAHGGPDAVSATIFFALHSCADAERCGSPC